MNMKTNYWKVCFAAASLFQYQSALGLVVHDFTKSHITDPGVERFGMGVTMDGVAQVDLFGMRGTGALLSDGETILTAAHLFDHNPIEVEVMFDLTSGPVSFTSNSFTFHPMWNGIAALGHDIALIHLDSELDSSIPRYHVYRGNSELGRNAMVIVGYGASGYGATGVDDLTDFGTKRVGLNRYERDFRTLLDEERILLPTPPETGIMLVYDFDSGLEDNNVFGDLGVASIKDETMATFGDSGGPVFIYNLEALTKPPPKPGSLG
jgi:hypothetical protein